MATYSFTGGDGKLYHLSKFRQADIIEFHKWVQYKPYFDFLSLKSQIDPALHNEQSRAILMDCSKKSKQQINDEAEQWQPTIEGGTHLIYLSLKRNHPELTAEHVSDIITTDNMEEVLQLLNVMNSVAGIPLNEDKKKGIANPSTPAPSIA